MSREFPKKYIIFLLLVLMLGCKKKASETTPILHREEDFSQIEGYVFTKSHLYVFDLEKNLVVNKIGLPAQIQKIFLSEDTLWLAGKSLYYFTQGKFKKTVNLPYSYKDIVKRKDQIFVLGTNKITVLPDKDVIKLKSPPVKFEVGFDRIWVLYKNGITVYRCSTLEEEHQIPLSNPIDFALTPYGMRLYVAETDTIKVFDTQQFTHLTDIPVQSQAILLRFTPAGNKLYCLTPTELYVIKRVTNKVQKKLKIEQGKFISISRDGSYGILAENSKVVFFDAGLDVIKKEVFLESTFMTTSPKDSRVYFITADKLIVISSDEFQPVAEIELKKGKEFIIKPKESYKKVPVPVAEQPSDTTFFTLQVGSSQNFGAATRLVELLSSVYYPAYISKSDGWYRVRVGLFQTKGDAEIIKKKLETLISETIWVARTSVTPAQIPNVRLRDVNQDGYTEEAVQVEGKKIIIFNIRNAIYAQVYSTLKEEETYTGQSEFKDIDGDGFLEIITPTVGEGVYSVISFENGEFCEELRHGL